MPASGLRRIDSAIAGTTRVRPGASQPMERLNRVAHAEWRSAHSASNRLRRARRWSPANDTLQSTRRAPTVPFPASLPGAKKKKAPEGAFNMLRLVRQAD